MVIFRTVNHKVVLKRDIFTYCLALQIVVLSMYILCGNLYSIDSLQSRKCFQFAYKIYVC